MLPRLGINDDGEVMFDDEDDDDTAIEEDLDNETGDNGGSIPPKLIVECLPRPIPTVTSPRPTNTLKES
eukprot:CAMPEP_0171296442 /NCGR_PEP_ID=MMETSP0816-20121228/5097_1 /TAXON_ID=420281 /ORGANISM="Proboscia inermis, Strain CCAP1064/1" /LENGTH=68 /DNA_ID=CAMNT_0011769861 /DNA_START=265 /DNA_END=467 /DNA_ORIENTATION=-